MPKILEVGTEHAGTIKILAEVLKDLLPEGNLEFSRGDDVEINNGSDSDSDIDSGSESELSSSDDEPKNKSKKDLTKKVKKTLVNLKKEKTKKTKKKDNDSDNYSDSESEVSSNSENSEKSKKPAGQKGGLKIVAVDTSKTVLLYAKLDADKFNKFICKPERLVLGVNFTFLYNHVKFVDKNDDITFMVNDEEKDQLLIKFNRGQKESISHLTLMDLNEDEPFVPSTSFDVVITMPSSEFQKTCRELKTVGDYVKIKCINESISFSCKGDYSRRTIIYKESSNGISIIHAKNQEDDDEEDEEDDEENDNQNKPFVIEGVYELKNLALFGKCSSLCEDIQVYMKFTDPSCILAIKYTISTLGRLFVCMAPLTPDNDEENCEDSEDSDTYLHYNKQYDDNINIKYK